MRAKAIKRFEFIPFMALAVTVEELDAIAGLDGITSIEEDRLAFPQLFASVPLVGGNNAWTAGLTGLGQTIAILDTGVDKTHPFLHDKVVSEACYSTTSADDALVATSLCPGGVTQSTAAGSAMPYAGSCPRPICDHGTHVAGIAVGNGDDSFPHAGIARDAKLIAIQVGSQPSAQECEINESPYPCVAIYTSDALLGIQRILALSDTYPIAAVNMSFASKPLSDQDSCVRNYPSYQAAIDSLTAAGIPAVIAAGNHASSSGIGAPACLPNAISVGATWDAAGGDNNCPGTLFPGNTKGPNLGTSSVDSVTCYSNSSALLSFFAPGSLIVSSVPGGTYYPANGTSMATPHVSGAWALLKQRKGTLSISEGLSALASSGKPVTDPRNGIVKPRIRVDAAIDAIGGLPTIDAFTVTPSEAPLGQPIAIGYTVSDAGGPGLDHVVIRRANGGGLASDPSWQDIASIPVAGTGPTIGSFDDSPPVAGTYWYGLAVFDQLGNSTNELQAAYVPVQVSVGSGFPVITSDGVASAEPSVPFSYQITATNNPTSYGASGLPSGLSIDPNTGLISGTPIVIGTFSVPISATNSVGTGLIVLAIHIGGEITPATERLVLLNLYAATAGASWKNNSNWNGPPGTECSWYGVFCDASGHVTEIALSNNNLRGPLPPLMALSSLQYFVVDGNQLAGPIPSPPASLIPGASTVCGNQLASNGNSAVDAAWVTATGRDWLACQVTIGARLVNISTRGQVLTGFDVMIGGFVISGSTSKTVVVRAIGPSLANYGVTGALANPRMQIVRSADQTLIAANDDWTIPGEAAVQLQASGFAPQNSLESAIMLTLQPGPYTAIVSGVGGATGVGLIEVYEVDHPEVELINISTRGRVSTGFDVMIGGFVVDGSRPLTVVVRATGPSLANQGVAGPLMNPQLQLVRSSDQATMASNDDWIRSSNASTIQASGFAPSNDLESAIYITLDPGAYTAIVSGVNNGTGVGLVEVYKVSN
jgi:subtilisin family serine protease